MPKQSIIPRYDLKNSAAVQLVLERYSQVRHSSEIARHGFAVGETEAQAVPVRYGGAGVGTLAGIWRRDARSTGDIRQLSSG
jgi:hypothetical protein